MMITVIKAMMTSDFFNKNNNIFDLITDNDENNDDKFDDGNLCV